MKRGFAEITDEEWGSVPHSFKPSRVLKPSVPPPPIESFAYGRNPRPAASAPVSDDCIEIGADSLEDDDAEVRAPARTLTASRCRRLVMDDDDEDEDEDGGPVEGNAESDGDLVEVFDIKSSDSEEEGEREDNRREMQELEDNNGGDGDILDDDDDEDGIFDGDDDNDDDGNGGGGDDDDDVVGKALQKCSKISVDLKEALYGSSFASCDRYSEVDASSRRIVNQVRFSNFISESEIEVCITFCTFCVSLEQKLEMLGCAFI